MALGFVFAFVAAVNAIRSFRPALLLDPDPAWAGPRLLLGFVVVAAAAAAGEIAAAGFLLLSRSSRLVAPLPAFSRPALAALAGAAFILGTLARLVGLGSIPEALWVDDVSEIEPALHLSGHWHDFADSIRPIPFGDSPTGTVGVAYLQFFRLLLLAFGTNTVSLRLPAALAGVAGLVTTALLARRVLPPGGGALAVIVLAGLYWSLILSRLGWVALVISPIVGLATLVLLHARKNRSAAASLGAGALMGIGAHVYLSAWVAAVGLLAVAAWPYGRSASPRRRFPLLVPSFFVLGLLMTILPLFLFRAGRSTPYFLRTRHQNVVVEVRYWRSASPAFEAAADGVSAPWLMSGARGWPENVQLGLVFRALLAITFLRALARPRDELSIIVLAQAGAALTATVLGGRRGVPNGFRFGYLSDLTAIAIAAGALWVLLLVRREARPILGAALVGLLAVGSLLGTRGVFLDFGIPGRDSSARATLIARAALRWERYGPVEIDPRLVQFKGMVAAIRRYRLDPGNATSSRDTLALPHTRFPVRFRITSPGTLPRPGERAVEQVPGRDWICAVVLAARSP